MKTILCSLAILLAFFAGAFAEDLAFEKKDKPPVLFANTSEQLLFIRGQRWSVQIQDNVFFRLSGAYGITDCKRKVIYLEPNLEYMAQRDALLHELFHAGTCDEAGVIHNKFWNSESEEGHEGIYKISDFMTSLLHDNPELGRYLIGQ